MTTNNSMIAPKAKESAYLARFVVVVNGEVSVSFQYRVAANSTRSALFLEKGIILTLGDTVCPEKVTIP